MSPDQRSFQFTAVVKLTICSQIWYNTSAPRPRMNVLLCVINITWSNEFCVVIKLKCLNMGGKLFWTRLVVVGVQVDLDFCFFIFYFELPQEKKYESQIDIQCWLWFSLRVRCCIVVNMLLSSHRLYSL